VSDKEQQLATQIEQDRIDEAVEEVFLDTYHVYLEESEGLVQIDEEAFRKALRHAFVTWKL